MEKKKIIAVVAALIGVLAFFLTKYALLPVLENIKVNNYLKKEAKTANEDCPYAANDELIVERIYFASNKKLVFQYRYINYSKSDFDLEKFKTIITQGAIEAFSSDDRYDEIRNKNVVFEFVYFDKQYKEITRIKLLLNTPIIAIDHEADDDTEKAFFLQILVLVMVVFVVGVVLYWTIFAIIQQQKVKLMMADERFKNAKLYQGNKPVAISPDGFIGVVNVPKIIIFHIKEIKGFKITFDKEKIVNDNSDMIFNDIISKIEPYLHTKTENVNLLLNTANKKAAVKIPLLTDNSYRYDTSVSSRGRGYVKKVALEITEAQQKDIKEFLSMLEDIEKSAKK